MVTRFLEEAGINERVRAKYEPQWIIFRGNTSLAGIKATTGTPYVTTELAKIWQRPLSELTEEMHSAVG